MADSKISALAEATTFDSTADLIPVVYDANGTPVTKKMTVANFRSYIETSIGTRYFHVLCFWYTDNVGTGDGAAYIHIPAAFNTWNLTEVHAQVITAGTTNTTDIQIHNVTDNTDMLSTKLTIDSGETGSNTAATPAVINTTTDDVATNDLLRVDVDAVSTTAPKGLIVTLGFTPA